MDADNAPPPTTPAASDRADTRKWVLPTAAVVAVAALIIALVLISFRDGTTHNDTADSTVPGTEVGPPATDPVADSTVTTDSATTTSTTTETATTTLEPTTTAAEGGPAPTFTAEAIYGGGETVTLNLAGVQSGLTVYDGVLVEIDVRCVVLLAPGIDGWNEWCGMPDTPARFLTGDGSTMWLVELDADVGTVSVTVPESGWTLTSNGCTSPAADLFHAVFPGPMVMTSAVCVPGEAFVGNSSVLFQPGSPDGGGAFVLQAADGTWTSDGGGTSIPCDAGADGVDRCPIYGLGAGEEMFSALLPIPPIGGASGTADVVGMRDATVDVRGVIGAATTSADIGAAVAAAFRDGTEEPAPVVNIFGGFGGWNVELAIIVIPAFDDSIRSTTYVIWVGSSGGEPVEKAFAFETCARGLAGGGLCI